MRTGLIAFAITLAACGPSGSRKYFQKADAYYAEAKYADASIQYRKALQADPQFGPAYYGLGLSELKRKHFSEGRAALERAVALMPEDDNAARELAQLCLTSYLGDARRPKELYDEIQSLAGSMLTRDAHSFDGLRLKGYLAMSESKFPEAIEYFRQANLAKPLQADVVTALVQNLLAQNQDAEAEALAFNLIEHQKTSVPIYDVLYFHYVGHSQPEKAEAILRRKIANNPVEPAYVIELCRRLRNLKKLAESESCLADLTARFPNGGLRVGDYYADLGDWAEAIRRYEQAAREHPADADVYRKRVIGVLIRQGKREEAAQALDSFLGQHPQDVETRGTRALLLVESRQAENVDRGVAEFKKLAAANPDSAELHEKLGMGLAAQADLLGAKAEFLQALKISPFSMPALTGLAEISVNREQFSDGLRYTTAILSRDPSNVTARLFHAACLTGSGQLSTARLELRALIAEDAHNAEAQLQVALLDVMEKHYADAEQRFRAYYKPGQGDFRALKGIVQIYAAQNQLPKAVPFLKDELQKHPGEAEIQGLLGDTAMRIGQYDLAIATYRAMVDRNPRNSLLLLNLGNACVAKGDYPAAVSALQAANQLQPNNPEITAVLGPALEAAGRAADAKTIYRSYLKAEPHDPVILNNLAFLMAETNESLEQALEFSQEALRTAPAHPDFLDTLALLHLKKNDTGAALQILANLTEKYAKNPAFRYHLGLVWLKSGSTDKAYAEFRTALALGLAPKEAKEARDLMRN